jgi:chromosome segregation ATPase
MKQSFKIISVVVWAALLLGSCDHKPANPTQSAEGRQRDSVQTELDQLNSFVDVVSASMDSISMSEGIIFKNNGEKAVTSREQIRRNITAFESLLQRQKARIAELEKSLGQQNDARTAKLRMIIKGLNKQIADKDTLIAHLKTELNDKNVSITKLQTHVKELDQNVTGLNQKNKEQEETITAQTNKMNEAYVKVATKAELKKEGLLTKSTLFTRKKLDITKLGGATFTKVDIRNFRSLKINGKRPQVLTQMPPQPRTA